MTKIKRTRLVPHPHPTKPLAPLTSDARLLPHREPTMIATRTMTQRMKIKTTISTLPTNKPLLHNPFHLVQHPLRISNRFQPHPGPHSLPLHGHPILLPRLPLHAQISPTQFLPPTIAVLPLTTDMTPPTLINDVANRTLLLPPIATTRRAMKLLRNPICGMTRSHPMPQPLPLLHQLHSDGCNPKPIKSTTTREPAAMRHLHRHPT